MECPQLTNRHSLRYHLLCSSRDRNGQRMNFTWCPSEDSVDPVTLEWLGDHTRLETFGVCPESLARHDLVCDPPYQFVRYPVSDH